MKRFLALCILVFVGVATWIIGSKLSADAIGMGVGVLFGVMAGIPTALLLLASNRRRQLDDDWQSQGRGRGQQHGMMPYGQYPQQPPVIVLAGGMAQPQQGYDPYGGRQGYAPAVPSGQREVRVLPPGAIEVDDKAPAGMDGALSLAGLVQIVDKQIP
ncbi:MAG: hypothetical protein R3A10_07930 [Caldilineaceae bacterium]